MKSIVKYFILTLAFLLVYRLLFMYKYIDQIDNPSSIIFHSLPVDLSTSSYLALLFVIFHIIYITTKLKVLPEIIRYLFFLICLLFLLVEYSSIAIYEHWGTVSTYRAASYLEDGTSGWKTLIENIDIFLFPSLIIFTIHIFLSNSLFLQYNSQPKFKKPILQLALLILIFLFLLRGGTQKIPISASKAFFSKNQTDNYAAVNKERYFIESYLNSIAYSQIKKIDTNAENIDSTMNSDCVDFYISKIKSPNIVLLIMEGIPSAALNLKRNDTLLLENLTRISKEGLNFTNAFSSGFRTDQGIASIFNGLPAYPYLNTLKQFPNLNKHKNLIDEMNSLGYKTSFIYGGESQFSNLKKYFLNTKLDNLIDCDYFPDQNKTSSWGVPDHILLDTAYNIISRSNNPSFTTILSSSTHVPFDIPGRETQLYNNRENFIASIEYLDEAINTFDKRISRLTDKETILIITSDHGSMHLGHDYNDHERFHIPLIVKGNCLDSIYINKKIHKNISLHDLPISILSLVKEHPQSSTFNISSNIFSQCSNSNSYWITDNVLGYIENSHNLALEHKNNNVFKSNLDQDSTALISLKQNAISTFDYYKYYLLEK